MSRHRSVAARLRELETDPVAPGTLRRAVAQFFADGTLPPDGSRAFGMTLQTVAFIVAARINDHDDGDGGAPAELLHLGAVLHLARDPATRAAARESLPAAVAAAGALAPRVTA